MEPPSLDPTTVHVRAACRGETLSVGWVIHRLTPHLLAQARFYLRNLPGTDVAPEDLVQEVWAVAFLRLPKLEPRSGRMTPVLATFLARTMRNKAMNWLRRRANLPPTRRDHDPSQIAALPAETRDVIRQVIAREHEGLIARALAELDETDREILILRGLEDNSYDDLAALLGIEAGALRMRYARARQRLRERLPESLFDELGD